MVGTNFPYTKHLPGPGKVRVAQIDDDPARAGARIETEVPVVGMQAAHALARSRAPAARPLQRWFDRVARRRGLRTALVALARRMLSLAFYLLPDGTRYEPLRLRRAGA
jgi:thiamine pyrophosphate-dependent acetolactate synthase large subunit-like protein